MKCLIVGDVHIGKGTSIGKDPVGVGLNSRIEDQKNLLEFVLNCGVKHKVSYIFLVGDIWQDVNPKSIMVKVFFEWIKRVTENDIQVVIVLGNHDFVRSGNEKVSMIDSLKVLDLKGVHIFTEPTKMLIDNINFVFFPFCDRKQLGKNTIQEAIDYCDVQIKQFYNSNTKNIVVGHMALEGSLWVGDELDEDSNEIFLKLSSFDNFDYVWMGHIHKWQVLKEKPHIAHIGSLDRTSFGETDKYIGLYDSDKNSCKYIKLPCRNLVDIKITVNEDSTEEVIKELQKYNKEDFANSIVRISVKTKSYNGTDADKQKIQQLLKELNVFHLCSFNESKDVERVLVKNAELDETIDHLKGVDIFVDSLNSEDNTFKECLKDVCKSIIKEFEIKKK